MLRTSSVFASVLLAILGVGCGDGKTGGPATPPTGIVGTWVFDRATPAGGGDSPMLDAALQRMQNMKVQYEFAADGTFSLREQVMSDKESSLTGTWELKDGRYVVTEKTKNGKPRDAADAMNTVSMELKDGGLSFAPPGSPVAFHLKRK